MLLDPKTPHWRRLAAVALGTLCLTTLNPTAGVAGPRTPATDGPAGQVRVLDPHATSPSGARCQDLSFPVRQFADESKVQQVFGQYCTRGKVAATTPVQILIHGGTYNHAYWDWPSEPGTYSYVDAATRQGFATLNIDRLGYGRSDRPDPFSLDFAVAGYVTHQLVQYLRAGAVGPRFHTVVLNGHSMGGLTAQREASTYQDVDAVIVTGVGHDFDPKGIAQVADKFYPADLDPKFSGKIPPGYMTTVPGNRATTFISPGKFDPAVVAPEESLKDTLSPTELSGITKDSYDHSITENITVPVFWSLGQHDLIWCPTTGDCNTDPQPAAEHTFYAPGVSYTQYIVPGSGHSINVTTAAPAFYQATFAWLRKIGIPAG